MKIYDFDGRKNISGERIREARLKRRLSQADLAARVQIEGITLERDSISRIEIGTRFVADYELMTFSKILGVDVNWLLSQDDTWPPVQMK
jgi:transcriptional regulator with XRE-family HTH domain